MPARHARHWNDVQTAIAAAAVVTTIGLWNLFATPAKTVTAQAPEPATLPPMQPPVASQAPVSMPQVKILFIQDAPQAKKNKKNNNHNMKINNAGSPSVTQTKSS